MKKNIAIIITNAPAMIVTNAIYSKVLYAAYAEDETSLTDFCPSDDVVWMEYVRDTLFIDDTDVVVDVYLDMSYDMSIPTAMGLMAASERWRAIIGRLMVLDAGREIDMTCLIK